MESIRGFFSWLKWHPAFRFSSLEPGVLEELTGRLRRLGHDRPHDQGPGELESGNLQMEVSFFCRRVFNVSRLDKNWSLFMVLFRIKPVGHGDV